MNLSIFDFPKFKICYLLGFDSVDQTLGIANSKNPPKKQIFEDFSPKISNNLRDSLDSDILLRRSSDAVEREILRVFKNKNAILKNDSFIDLESEKDIQNSKFRDEKQSLTPVPPPTPAKSQV